MLKVNYTKTLLHLYRHINDYKEDIKACVYRKALKSYNDKSSPMAQFNKIIELTNEFNILSVIDDVLTRSLDKLSSTIPSESFEIIYNKWVCGNRHKVYNRRVFRIQLNAIKRLSELIEFNGISNEWFIKYCMQVDIVKKILDGVERGVTNDL